MIKSFAHKGLQVFFETGSKAGIQAAHAQKLRRQLVQLDLAQAAEDMNIPGWRLHCLKGEFKDHFSVSVNGNWRLTFRFVSAGVVELVNYQDYH